MTKDSFGAKLKHLRIGRRLNGRQLARALGISPPYLSQLESGRAIPSEELARRIAKFFRQRAEELLFLARRVPAKLGDVFEEFPGLAPAYVRQMAAYSNTGENLRRGLMVRVVGAPREREQLVDLATPLKRIDVGGIRPPMLGPGSALADTLDSIRPSIVAFASKLVITRPGDAPVFPEIIGTGFVVDPCGIVVANRHVVEALQALPRNPVTGARSDMAIVWSNVESTSDGHILPILFVDIKAYSSITSFSSSGPYYGQDVPDLAFVQLNARDVPAVTLATEANTLRAGISVATAGFPLGTDPLVAYGSVTQLMPFLRRGIISSLYPFPCPNPHGFTIDIMSQPGSSGSPVFLTDVPKVVGIVHAGIPGTNVTVAIPSLLVRDALNACTNGSPLDLEGVPTLQSLLEESERSSELKWQSFIKRKPSST